MELDLEGRMGAQGKPVPWAGMETAVLGSPVQEPGEELRGSDLSSSWDA